MSDSPQSISDLLGYLIPDAPQEAPGITIVPLLRTGAPAFEYVSMGRAFGAGSLAVREVSQGGSVPELLVENAGDKAVLLLDGEEVAGAKQNRMLNTSIMVDAHGRLVVPVSCTEAGRWGYASPEFKDSGYVAPRSVRMPKSLSVHESLRRERRHRSDQGQVWENVEKVHYSMGTESRTHALRDAMEQTRGRFDEIVAAFAPIEGQVGLIAVCADGFVGLDVLSRAEVFADVHAKLVRSYVVDVMASGRAEPVKLDGQVDRFLASVRTAKVEAFDSPGRGTDHRLAENAVRGASLVVDGEVVHLGAFTVR